jgi:hypothetical protein
MMMEDEILVRQGKGLVKKDERNHDGRSKHFVFDLDETLGSFRELYMLSTASNGGEESSSSLSELIALLRLFPEFLRPGIIPILKFLKLKKEQQLFGNFYVYTNNQCGRSWTENLVKAIEIIADTPHLVDHIICAFKIDNVVVESRRTCHWKTWHDLVRCTLLPSKAMICFIDDTYFPKMNRDRVFYLQPRPYEHFLGLSDIAHRLMSTSVVTVSPSLIQEWSSSSTNHRRPDDDNYSTKSLSKRLMYYISEFFNLALRRPRTRKIKGRFWYNLTQKKPIYR